MKHLPRITEIIKIEPFKISCRWTTAEVRVVDFEMEFDKWEKQGNQLLCQLKDYSNFENVVVKDGTLQWPSIQVSYTGLDGKPTNQPLDLDPDVLYEISKALSLYLLIPVEKLDVNKKTAV